MVSLAGTGGIDVIVQPLQQIDEHVEHTRLPVDDTDSRKVYWNG